MKKTFLLTLTLALFCCSFAQTYKLYDTKNYHNQLRLNTKTGEVLQIQDDGQTFVVNYSITPFEEFENRYYLVPTRNYWTFILVDSFTGKLWQTQFSVKSVDNMFSIPINDIELSTTKRSKFSVQPMTSMYQFYLINDDTGEMWKFQWTTKEEEGYRWIEKIY